MKRPKGFEVRLIFSSADFVPTPEQERWIREAKLQKLREAARLSR